MSIYIAVIPMIFGVVLGSIVANIIGLPEMGAYILSLGFGIAGTIVWLYSPLPNAIGFMAGQQSHEWGWK